MVCEDDTMRGALTPRLASWYRRRAREVAGALPALGLVLLVGCNKSLDKETAEKILLQQEFTPGRVECVWDKPIQKTSTEWTFLGFAQAQQDCASQLVETGLAKLGGCYEKGCGPCCAELIEATSKSRLDEKKRGLTFTCGQSKLGQILSITTEGNKATVKYERELTFEPVVGELSKCKLTKPEAGRKTQERQFVRDDAGNWSVK